MVLYVQRFEVKSVFTVQEKSEVESLVSILKQISR